MITASHNPPADNGLKFSNEHGESIEEAQEAAIERVVNCEDLVQEVQVPKTEGPGGCVFVGRDTRESSPRLYGVLR